MAAIATGSADGSGGTAGAAAAPAVVPAQLGFLAIYNPSLGTTDETLEDQIVYYASGTADEERGSSKGRSHRHRHRHQRSASSTSSSTSSTLVSSASARNERLRHIGLAQGMVAFGKSFSGNQSVDTIDTDKTRVVLHELEPGWWILASVDLTRLPVASSATGDSASASTANTTTTSSSSIEYSSREVKPAALLLQDLLRAHAVFLLHHDISLAALFARVTPRSRFTSLLARYWDVFLSSWSVLLHGNPVRDVLPGLRMAACGELGIGVGEEDRGSGEREVLEGIVEQTDGLVDLVVCKFGDEEKTMKEDKGKDDQEDGKDDRDGGRDEEKEEEDTEDDDDDDDDKDDPWLGTGRSLGAEDGAIFLGVGAVSRPSLRTLTYWLEDVYTWGLDAYGLFDNPSAPRPPPPPRGPAKRRKKPTAAAAAAVSAMGSISEQPSSPPSTTTSSTELPRTQQSQALPSQRRRSKSQQRPQQASSSSSSPPPLLPPPPVTQLARRSKPMPVLAPASNPPGDGTTAASASPDSSGAVDKYMSYMKLGYGTYWSLTGSVGGSTDGPSNEATTNKKDKASKKKKQRDTRDKPRNIPKDSAGQYLIGLVEDVAVDSKQKTAATADVHEDGAGAGGGHGGGSSAKPAGEASKATEHKTYAASIPPRTVVVELAKTEGGAGGETARPVSQDTIKGFKEETQTGEENPTTSNEGHANPLSVVAREQDDANADANASASVHLSKTEKLRLVVYAKRPFLCAFLFRQRPDQGGRQAEDHTPLNDYDEKEAQLQVLLRQQLSVLHKPLLHSTAHRPDMPNSASGAEALLAATASALGTAAAGSSYDLIWDPLALTIHSTIPNIPEPWPLHVATTGRGSSSSSSSNAKKKNVRPRSTSLSSFVPTAPAWSRVEALNTHMQILHLYTATRANPSELERTCKTSRAWWIVWNRVVERSGGGHVDAQSQSGSAPGSAGSAAAGSASPGSGGKTQPPTDAQDDDGGSDDDGDRLSAHSGSTIGDLPGQYLLSGAGPDTYVVTKEIFLIRRASDHADIRRSSVRSLSSTYPDSTDGGGGGAGWTDGASRLAQGISGDTKRYLEGLLSLNR